MKQKNKNENFAECYYLFGNLLTGKRTIKANEKIIREGQNF